MTEISTSKLGNPKNIVLVLSQKDLLCIVLGKNKTKMLKCIVMFNFLVYVKLHIDALFII